MNSNKGNMNDTDKTGEIIYWVIIIILLFALPPVGLILLLAKLGVFSGNSKGNSNVNSVKKVNKRRSRLEKKTGKGLSVFLLIVAIGLFAAGATVVANSIADLAIGGLANIARFGLGIFYLLGGLIAFFSRNIVAKRLIRYKNYYAFINERGIVPLADIAQTTGVSIKTVIRDAHAMINSGFLDPGAYIDNELECLVLSPEDAYKLRMDIMSSQNAHVAQSDDVSAKSYAVHLAEFREVKSSIKDEVIAEKITRLEELSEKIFKIVEESPEKQPQIRRFMSYYLPTTLKLVRSYATLESQGIKGENIMSTKKSIGSILDTLLVGYEQQLDQLFKADAIDIASDINVLENLMKQDGLTGTTFTG
ncbi:MAG: 5-bromo-4-chloroindolyl phosphate hydrolysis family protein [Oscillospiraceae bacterium]|nr:5-bromo-4-chloroindolyl phosphate hydrolysis family protein [Oscillospiraceae bacterium]